MRQPQNPDESFTYDKVGNRETSHLSASHTHNDINQLIQDDQYDYTYDADGNLTSKTDRSTSETTTYTFDAENRMTRIDLPDTTIITYAYDPMGRRIEKNVNGTVIRYIYDGEDILLELDGSNTVRAYYTHGPGIDEPLVMERDTDVDGTLDQKVFYHTDGLGSIKILTDASGNVVQTYLYDSFGNLVAQTGTIDNPYTYTAREFDSESGLYFYRARFYDARIGRFISEDPIGFKGGINFYGYVYNSPVNYIDPSGLHPPGKLYGGPHCHIKNEQIWKNIDKLNDPNVRDKLSELLMNGQITQLDLPFDFMGLFSPLPWPLIFLDEKTMQDPFEGPRTLAHEYKHYDQWQKDWFWYSTNWSDREDDAYAYENEATLTFPKEPTSNEAE